MLCYLLQNTFIGAVDQLGKEQFLGLYLSAGVISSFTSYAYKILANQPGLSLGAVSYRKFVVSSFIYARVFYFSLVQLWQY